MWKCKENCGACCRALKEPAKNFFIAAQMRLMDRGDGVCKHLGNDNRCRIYNNRPNLCVIKQWKYTDEQIKSACNVLIDKYRPEVSRFALNS